ncbi:hypothetical protein [Streptomyces djakartensis]|uniref:hypothetical protein n=1 Tax=Streptomyces djakartensis TaxID=68193 RepID=UPI0034DF1985
MDIIPSLSLEDASSRYFFWRCHVVGSVIACGREEAGRPVAQAVAGGLVLPVMGL